MQRTIIRGNEIDYRTRAHAFLETASARTLRLPLEPSFSAEDYLLGVFPSGADIPSPYFADCPTITPLSLDDAAAVELAAVSLALAEANAWYRIELSAGEYRLSSSAQRQDGASSNIVYEITTSDRFGQASCTELLTRVARLVPVPFRTHGTIERTARAVPRRARRHAN